MHFTINDTSQCCIFCYEDLIPSDSQARKLMKIFDFKAICNCVGIAKHQYGAIGYGKDVLIKSMIYQFYNCFSDREMAKALKDSNECIYFTGIHKYPNRPDHSTLVKFRKVIGMDGMHKIFNEVNRQLKPHIHNFYHFIDSTKQIVKNNPYEEVRAVKEFLSQEMDVICVQLKAKIDAIEYLSDDEKIVKYEELLKEINFFKKLTNGIERTIKTVTKVSICAFDLEVPAECSCEDAVKIVTDVMKDDKILDKDKKKAIKKRLISNCNSKTKEKKKQKPTKLINSLINILFNTDANIGAKSIKEFWFGYKETVVVDMFSGLITNTKITPASIPDWKAAISILPDSGTIVCDKGYIGLERDAKEKGLHTMIIKPNNMKDKNPDLDRFISKLRGPFENIFSKMNKITKYKGLEFNQGIAYMRAVAFNMKRALVLAA
jgi:IS5 family transposase